MLFLASSEIPFLSIVPLLSLLLSGFPRPDRAMIIWLLSLHTNVFTLMRRTLMCLFLPAQLQLSTQLMHTDHPYFACLALPLTRNKKQGISRGRTASNEKQVARRKS